MKKTKLFAGMMTFAVCIAASIAVSAETIEIDTAEEFKAFRDSVNAGDTYEGDTVLLTSNIDLNGEEWVPIGTGTRSGGSYTADSKLFKGIFDGQGNKISGIKISDSEKGVNYASGLFGVVAGGTVTDLVADVTVNVTNSEMAGGVIGLLTDGGTASKITVNGSVTASRGNGGVVGRMTKDGTISDCVNNADITSLSTNSGNVGGIVGAAYYTEIGKEMNITSCVNNGKITSYRMGAGGIVGLSASNVTSCINNAAVSGNGTSIGGIVGEQQNYGDITGCVNYGSVANTDSTAYGTGGIAGWIRYSGAVSSYPLKEMVTIMDNVNYAAISGGNDGGGIIGTLYNAGIVKNNRNYAPSISSKTFGAGIVGNFQTTESPESIEKCDVTLTNNITSTLIENIKSSLPTPFIYINENTVTMSKNAAISQPQEAIAETGEDGSAATGFVAGISSGDSYTLENMTWFVTSGGETRSILTRVAPIEIEGDVQVGLIVSGIADENASARIEIDQ